MEIQQEHQFRQKVNDALVRAKVILDANKHPVIAEDAQHHYSDKYLLAESMTNAAVASQLNCLASLGLDVQKLQKLQGWAVDRQQAVSLVFRAEERCSFARESTRDVTDPTQHVSELSVDGVVKAAFASKTVTTVTEYFWKFQAWYALTAICGVGEQPEDRLEIRSRRCEHEMMTTTKATPRPEVQLPAVELSVNITWLLRQLMAAGSASPMFKIDRTAKACHTPRRNADTQAALDHFNRFNRFGRDVNSYIQRLWSVHSGHGLDTSALAPKGILVPVLPLLEPRDESRALADGLGASASAEAETEATTVVSCLKQSPDITESTLLAVVDSNKFLEDEQRCLQKKHDELSQAFPGESKVVSAAEAIMTTTFKHCSEVCSQLMAALDYIESMLRRQLIAAIGKVVTPADFAEYMRFHSRKLFAEAYQPAPFCFAVRRTSRHSPEGVLSIEALAIGGGDTTIFEPVVTTCARTSKAPKMQFALNASTSVQFGGDRHLHGWLQHQFSHETGSSVRLVARARQFSSMIVLIGRITSATGFAPMHAAIVQNKDELTIPLDMSMIPSAKEFRDAISSLSPEQQDFAKAFRSMQLESTMFGVLVIQIKPQLERVLNLPEDSLTKEIKLSQDLMQLFIKYNIPADLLSFDAVSSTDGFEVAAPTAPEKIAAVKQHVQAMYDMIKASEQGEIEQRKREAQNAFETRVKTTRLQAYSADTGMDFCCSMFDSLDSACSVNFCSAPVAAVAEAHMAWEAPLFVPPGRRSQRDETTDGRRAGPEAPMAGEGQGSVASTGGGRDWTQVPREMDEKFESLDKDAALRPTIINPGDVWQLKAQKALLASPTTTSLHSSDQKSKKEEAFDLLDGLTKAGAIDIEDASLHIVVASTHCFDKSVIETLVQDNVNPIERVERSTLIMAATLHQQPPAALIRDSEKARLTSASPQLFLEDR